MIHLAFTDLYPSFPQPTMDLFPVQMLSVSPPADLG